MLTAPSEAVLRNGWKPPQFSHKNRAIKWGTREVSVPGAYLRMPSLVITVL